MNDTISEENDEQHQKPSSILQKFKLKHRTLKEVCGSIQHAEKNKPEEENTSGDEGAKANDFDSEDQLFDIQDNILGVIKQSDEKGNTSKKKFNRTTKGNLINDMMHKQKKDGSKQEAAYFLSDSQLINSDSKKEKRILETSTVSNKK